MKEIHVAVAVLSDHQGRVLLTRRPVNAHQGGLWEFPGGKLEPGESLSTGLARELREELGIRVEHHRPLIRVAHDYGDKRVLLDVQRVTSYLGEAVGVEGQPLEWILPHRLADYSMPDADRPIVTAINLPSSYLITGNDPARPTDFMARLEGALESGHRLVQLRAPTLDSGPYRDLAIPAMELCGSFQARLLLNCDPLLAAELGADGVHLNSRRLMEMRERPLGEGQLVAASCHNPMELKQAVRLGVDFALLSPVLPTTSHPRAIPLGWKGFTEMVDRVPLPVFALGGMRPAMLDLAWRQGAQGVAGISGFWSG